MYHGCIPGEVHREVYQDVYLGGYTRVYLGRIPPYMPLYHTRKVHHPAIYLPTVHPRVHPAHTVECCMSAVPLTGNHGAQRGYPGLKKGISPG